MPTPTTTLVLIGTLLAVVLAYEVLAIATGGWTISESWWLWSKTRPWMNVLLAAALAALFAHLALPG